MLNDIFTDDGLSLCQNGVGFNAMRLAMTRTLAEEEELKQNYARAGIRFVVTEVGGNTKRDFQEKVSRAVFGAALNAGVIEKEPHEVHALIHAAEEAKHGAIVNISSEANVAVKIGIVRERHWIAVAMFGESAINPITNHQRCGLGVMNI